ncbi:MAG: lamin tail domain-containing protein [Verrucomicrobia bacterium]|nr:lamin tail domain-containing protein [Verrucomicrobiota bacterium]
MSSRAHWPVGFFLSLMGILLLAQAEASATIVYDAASALVADETVPGAENGVNGVWTYGGYNPTLKVFTPFTAAQHINHWPLGLPNPPPQGTFQGYGSLVGDQTPALLVNTDLVQARVPCCDIAPISPGKFLIHPSSPGGNNFGDTYDVPVTRWTAPAAGSVLVIARWIQRHANPQQAVVLTNGVKLFTGVLAMGTGLAFSSKSLTVAAGDRIDVGVAPGPGGYSAGTSELDFRIEFTLANPEPIVLSLQPASLTVNEGASATFRVTAANLDLVSYQWQRDQKSLLGATNELYELANVGVSDDGAVFRCVLTNVVSTNISSDAVPKVLPDTVAPTLVGALNDGATSLTVFFSEPVEAAGATNVENYSLAPATPITRAVLAVDRRSVLLTTSALSFGASYTLTVSKVRDVAAAANPIADNSTWVFTPLDYRPKDIGNPPLPAVVSAGDGGYNISASGRDIGGVADQCHLSFQLRAGDFDIRVRVASLDFSDLWAKAGLMARESLDANSRFVSVLATPSVAGTFFLSRTATAGEAVPTGSFPVNYPHTWLRLRRAGMVFTGFASLDGEHWTQLGSVSAALPSTLYFGMAVASHDPSRATTARMRDLESVTPANSGPAAPLPFEPLAACSRRTQFVISEIMYHPPQRGDGRNLEFIEVYNSNPFPEDLSGHQIAGDVNYAFPSNSILQGGAFAVVAASPKDMRAVYGISNIVGSYSGSLKKSGVVKLLNERGAVLLDTRYDSQAPWPYAADGLGHSLVMARPSYGESDPRAWRASDLVGGSPGSADSFGNEPLRFVVVNEYIANSDAPQRDFIELYNASNQEVDLSGAGLSDDPSAVKYRFPNGTILKPQGFISRDEIALGFGLRSSGDEIILVNSNRSRVIEAIKFGGQAAGVSRGRSPDGSPFWSDLTIPTPGGTNAPPLNRDIVFNEIMYHPISGLNEDAYIELINRGTNEVDLAGWRLSDGIGFTFPPATIVPPSGFMVVAADVASLRTRYSNLGSTNSVGNYAGSLKGAGERLAIEMPLVELKTNSHGVVATNLSYVLVNELTYGTGGRWGPWTDGGGSSLELVDARADNRWGGNWAPSDPVIAPAPWTSVENTGVLDLGNPNYPATAVQILLLGEGECLVDNIEVISGGRSLLANGTFENGVGGWIFDGNHEASTLESGEGYNSARSLHVRATGDGDCNANRIRASLIGAIKVGAVATLRAKVRWLRGHPEILLRLRGNWLEAYGALKVPSPLGTPGLRNSRSVDNTGPALLDVVHSPILPAANQPVVVSARILDPDGVASARLRYRLDPATTFSTVMMVDDGSNGDDLAGDGVFSATLPPRPANSLVAFYIEATDGAASPVSSRFPADAPARECLVRFGEAAPFGGFGTYRLWMSQATANRWASRGPASNQPLDCSFVYGGERVVYNVGAYYSGSPFKTASYSGPMGNPCDYDIRFPDDDSFMGSKTIELAFPGNLNSYDDPSAQREQFSYWIARQAGLPYNARRYVNLFVNGTRRGQIIEDTQVPNRDVTQEWFPADPDGDLYKTAIWYDVDNVLSDDFSSSRMDASMANFTTTGGEKKTARYRWNFQAHAVRGSANNFTNLFRLVDALNSPAAGYTEAVEALVDTEEWMRVFAFEHLVGNWDTLGFVTGANMFPYKGRLGKWTLFPWDLDISFVATPPGSDLFQCDDSVLARMNSNPPFRRAYWRALRDFANGPLLGARMDGFLDPRYAALRANGLNVSPPDDMKSFLAQQRGYILSQLATVNPKFALKLPPTVTTNKSTLVVRGSAPVDTAGITLNGKPLPIVWVSVTDWTAQVPLECGANALTFTALGKDGLPIAGVAAAATIVTVNCPPPPQLTDFDILPNGDIIFICRATPGYLLRVEYQDALGAATWTLLRPELLAQASQISFQDSPKGSQRFYRARQSVP